MTISPNAVLASLVLAVALMSAGGLQAKPGAPLNFAHDVPPAVTQGEALTTTLRVVSDVNLSSLEIVVRPYEGVEMPAGEQTFSFTDVEARAEHSVDFEVVLTATPVGYVSVTGRTVEADGRTQQKVIAIRYGAASP